MKCPECGQELRPSKKDPDYMLCYDCKKKYRIRRKQGGRDEEEQRYSNIPPKQVRDKREREMRKAYDDMLSVGDGKAKKRKPVRDTEPEDDYEDDYDDFDDYEEKGSKLPFIILGIAIVAVAAVIVYMYFR